MHYDRRMKIANIMPAETISSSIEKSLMGINLFAM